MNSAESMISYNNKIYRKDAFVRAVYTAAGGTMEMILNRLNDAEKQIFFDTMTEDGARLIEGYLGITPPDHASIEDRRQNIQSNWFAAKGKKFTIKMIRDVSEAWDNGAVDVQFTNGKIIITFIDIIGIPKYVDKIKETIEKIKPAHLDFEIAFRYNTYGMVGKYTHEQLMAARYTYEELRTKALPKLQ